MGRIARVVVPGFPHHVTQRGARKQQTFFGENDYRMYVGLLSKARQRSDTEILAYCLMPNHIHLIVVPRKSNGLAELLRYAHRTYAVAINAREGWQGHLWQERFHSFVMDEQHLLAAVRYVELNPVRAGICRRPGDWPWSSYRAHVNAADDSLVVVEPMLERVADWRRFVRSENQDAAKFSQLRERSRTGLPIGADDFIDELETITGRSLRPPKLGRPKKV